MTIKKIAKNLGKLMLLLITLSAGFFPKYLASLGDIVVDVVKQQPASVSDATGVGGSDYTPLGGDFLHTAGDYICDGNHWSLDGSKAIATYASSTKIGSTFQFEFTPTGIYAANTQFGRTRVYEVSFGANSYEHLLVKNLQDNSNIGLYGDDKRVRKGRQNIGFSLSSTTPNISRIEEIVVSENLLKLKITVNGKEFETEEFRVNNNEKYDVVYLALIDTSEGGINTTGLLAPELKICP